MSDDKNAMNLATMATEGMPTSPDVGDLMAVVAHYQSPLLRYVGNMLGTTNHEAEDIVQETFVRLHQQVAKKGRRSIHHLSTWLFKTAQNLTIDAFRQGAKQTKAARAATESASLKEQAAKELDALGEVLRQEAREVALRELAELDDTYRQVVLLKIIQGMTLRQVAEVAGISISLANYRLNKGLEELARRLQKAGVV